MKENDKIVMMILSEFGEEWSRVKWNIIKFANQMDILYLKFSNFSFP